MDKPKRPNKYEKPISLHPLGFEEALQGLMQVKPEKEKAVTYRRLEDWPEWIQVLVKKMPLRQQNRFLYPSPLASHAKLLQDTWLQVLETDKREGASEGILLRRIREFADTDWPVPTSQ